VSSPSRPGNLDSSVAPSSAGSTGPAAQLTPVQIIQAIKRFGTRAGLHVHPEIDPAELISARPVVALPASESIIALADLGLKRRLLFATDAVYYNDNPDGKASGRGKLTYRELPSVELAIRNGIPAHLSWIGAASRTMLDMRDSRCAPGVVLNLLYTLRREQIGQDSPGALEELPDILEPGPFRIDVKPNPDRTRVFQSANEVRLALLRGEVSPEQPSRIIGTAANLKQPSAVATWLSRSKWQPIRHGLAKACFTIGSLLDPVGSYERRGFAIGALISVILGPFLVAPLVVAAVWKGAPQRRSA
jgi:hypothetical protein